MMFLSKGGSGGKATDWTSHLGGAVVGILWTSILTYLKNEWDDPSRRRLGVYLLVGGTLWCVLCFLIVFYQFWKGHSDRVVRAYFTWLELYKIQLKRPEPGRRWTVDRIEGIEQQLNINARAPLKPPTEEEVEAMEKANEWRADDAVALAIAQYEARKSVA
eukprot:Blabericola_migrator_1__5467@NODE_2795_length_2342_cov_156_509890_g60_i1_p2_GENE_NODE_2795_length_2342_cov_156_509890_g60_i1NODE_2795_length_2342_cov_156_509890_g60_i1_p2_ORF_typecomplete_len161_score25_55DUF2079/PF09852_9/0_018AA_permease/PF00324_21/0_028MASE5/PF17178_4/0_087DUF1129/PF06570_11/0_092Rhomboid/PF01694_22/0_093Rhomboid/PF01694_22/1_1e03COX14/PF14880_6/0_35HisKA_4TM/PF16926_5/0_26_NODE_2795_length_2342_cov_156_509890_g60_i1190672